MPCIIGTAGHIDHGKTALVKALTGIDTDRLTEEKKRGVSIDLGFAYFDIKSGDKEKLRAAIVDVPGHERFIKNMLAGVSGIDMVLFCVAADDGVMPQTIEHLDIVRLLGVKRGVFVVTKKDLVTFKRSEEVKKAVHSLISNTALKDAPVVSASTFTGEGIEELKVLIGSICTGAGRGVDNKYFRLPVDRSFTVKGFGTVLTGTVASGTVSVGDEVFLFPGGEKLRVRGLESHHEKAERISAGQRGAVNVTGLSYTEAERGFTLTRPDLWRYVGAVKGSLRVDCVFEFTGFADPKGTHPIKRGSGLKFHHMTSDCPASIQFADRKEAMPGERLYGRVYLKRPLLILRGDRFILRDPSTQRTVGGGTALMPYFSRRMMPGMADVPYGSFEKGDVGEMLGVLFRKTDLTVDRATLSLMLNVRDKDLKGLLAKTDYEVEAKEVMSLERMRGLKKKVMEIIEIYHAKHPGDLGIAEETIAGKLGSRFHPPALKKVMDELVRDGLAARKGPVVSSVSHMPASGGVDAKIEEGIKKAVREGFNPTTMAELEKLPFKKQDLERVLNYLNRRSILIKLTEGVYITGERLEEARKKLEDHLRDKGKIKAAEFRDLLGCGRKFAIEILEYFDKERLTLRQGDYRILRQA